MPKIQETGGRFCITLPKQYVRLLGWGKGTELVFLTAGEGELKIKELKGY